MFSKSKTQRFKDNVSCAPPVGSYNVNIPEAKKLTTFQKSERFKEEKDAAVGSGSFFHDSSTLKSISGSDKQLSFLNAKHSSLKKRRSTMSIKKSIQHLSDLDICRKSLEADVEFQESKINSLLERVKSLEKELKDSKAHSEEIEKCNQKYLDLIGDIRSEKVSVEEKCLNLSIETEKYKEQLVSAVQRFEETEKTVLTLKSDLAAANTHHENEIEVLTKENKDLTSKLESSQLLNEDFKEQLQTIEWSMTGNIQSLSEKYEELESTLDNVHKDYKHRLERSNSLLEKTKEANVKSNSELENLEQKYAQLKTDFDDILNEKEDLAIKIEKTEAEKDDWMEKFQMEKKKKEDEEQELFSEIQCLKNKLSLKHNEVVKLQQCSNEYAETISRLEEKNLELTFIKGSQAAELSQLKIESVSLEEKMKRFELEVQQLNEMIEEERKSSKEKYNNLVKEKTENEEKFKKLQGGIANQLMTTQIKLTNAEEKLKSCRTDEDLKKECQLWREKYEELEEKVRPFMNELDRYEMEKNALLNENQLTQQEMSRLSDKYAQLLGHQNNKQKIHHIQKLKEENFSLKKEVMNLRAHQKFNKSQPSSRKKFDPSKAFQHNKENTDDEVRKPLSAKNS